MKKIKGLNREITTLGGISIQDENGVRTHVGKTMAGVLSLANTENAVLSMRVAQKLYDADDELLLEDTEFEILRKSLEENKTLANIAKAPCLQVLEAAESVDVN